MKNILLNRNFALLFWGRLTTNIGDSLYAVASIWLVYELGGSSLFTGLAWGLTSLPSGFSFLFGPLIDRIPYMRLIITAQLLQAGLISIILLTYILGILNIYIILIVIPLSALLNSIAYIAENAAVPAMVSSDELVAANSAMSVSYQGTDLIFNAVSGLLVTIIGAVYIITFDVITFLVAVALFSLVRLSNKNIDKQSKSSKQNVESYKTDLAEGFKFAKKSIIWPIMLSCAVINFMFGASLGILPTFAAGFGDAEMYGFLLTALSVGLLLGALVSSRFDNLPIGRLIIVSFLFVGFFWLCFVHIPGPLIKIIFFALAAFPIGLTNVIFISLTQKLSPENMLGRVQAIQGSVNTIGMPLGAVLGGWLATLYGEPFILTLSGVAFIIFALYWLLNFNLRVLPQTNSVAEVKNSSESSINAKLE